MADPVDANAADPETTRLLIEINGLRQAMRGVTEMPTAVRLDEAHWLEQMKILLRRLGVERGAVLWKAALREVRRDCAQVRRRTPLNNQ